MVNLTIKLTPIILTILLVLWTVAVSPYSKYGDNWAIYPALVIFPIVFFWHIYLCFSQHPKLHFLLYGFIHLAVLFVIWIYCLMKISKDAL